MTQASPFGGESKQNESENKLGPQLPAFKPSLLLDHVAGEFSADPAYAKVTLTLIDGTRFECFADGVSLKGWSDRFLALAGHVMLRSRGEPLDLRPLSDLDEEDNEDDEPLKAPTAPPANPLGAPMPLQGDLCEECGEIVPDDGTGCKKTRDGIHVVKITAAEMMPLPGGEDDPGMLDAPPHFATAFPLSGFEHTLPMYDGKPIAERPERVARTRDFVESFSGKPAEFFTDYVRRLIVATLPHVNLTNEVIAISKVAGIDGQTFAKAILQK